MSTTTAGTEPRTDAASSAIAKAAKRIVPFIVLLYVINYLDRVNVGYAALTMNKDLGLSSAAFGLGAGLFFIGYFLFEVPSNLLLHRFGARVWIARIMVTWGLAASAMMLVDSKTSFYIVRFLLGVAEAGFFPGLLLYLGYWFPRKQRATITAAFLLAIPISGVLGSPLSALLVQHGDGIFGLAGWRFMYLVEGIPAIALGFLTLKLLPSRPVNADWLTAEEQTALTEAIAAEDDAVAGGEHATLKQALTNTKVLALAVVYFGIVFGIYSLSFFLPQVIAGFQASFGIKFSLFQIGLVTAIPFTVAAVAMWLSAKHSDRTGERRLHVALPLFVAAGAFAVALYMGSPTTVVIALSICAAGTFAAIPAFWQIPSKFLTGVAAAGAIGLINSFGNLSGFAAPYLTGWLKDWTGDFRIGMLFVAGFMALAAIIALRLRVPGDEPATKTAASSADWQPSNGQDRWIDINAASADELAAVPGIGRIAALTIAADRDRHGLFASLNDLNRCTNFPLRRVEALREQGVYAGAPA